MYLKLIFEWNSILTVMCSNVFFYHRDAETTEGREMNHKDTKGTKEELLRYESTNINDVDH
ncbi:hypothetical protein CAL7716_024640 [Calothrix sp. PCC 7716]|nr:hypothetical protein CAL7716_024640 [Calothrix sp. PCC 7716]